MIKFGIYLAEIGVIPDWMIRVAARFLTRQRLADSQNAAEKLELIEQLSKGGIAEKTDDANEQHYEVPTEFFQLVLGKHLKYSCNLFEKVDFQDQAEQAMLDLYIERAGITNNQDVLDLGCGWGSFSLYAAKRFPSSRFTCVSNSQTQIDYIKNQAEEEGIGNLTPIRSDVNELSVEDRFDRIISIEMFEHLRNYQSILSTLNLLLKDSGKLFIHIFCHKSLLYLYEIESDSDWMTKYFFQGGIMPSLDIFEHFDESFRLADRWSVNGRNYSKTSKLWLRKMYQNRAQIMRVLSQHYDDPRRWFNRWRIFFLTCEVFFALNDGDEYFVSHHLLEKNPST